jgi:hypothetical protein
MGQGKLKNKARNGIAVRCTALLFEKRGEE